MKTRIQQIEEMLAELNEVASCWNVSDASIERILPTVYWLEAELKEEKEKLAIDKAD